MPNKPGYQLLPSQDNPSVRRWQKVGDDPKAKPEVVAKAQAVLSAMKELGIDLKNMSPEEIRTELLRLKAAQAPAERTRAALRNLRRAGKKGEGDGGSSG